MLGSRDFLFRPRGSLTAHDVIIVLCMIIMHHYILKHFMIVLFYAKYNLTTSPWVESPAWAIDSPRGIR